MGNKKYYLIAYTWRRKGEKHGKHENCAHYGDIIDWLEEITFYGDDEEYALTNFWEISKEQYNKVNDAIG